MTNPSPQHSMISNNNKNLGTIARKPPVTSPSNSNDNEPTEDTYKQLKRKIKEITELNVAMSRDYFHAKRKIRTLTFERNLLLDNIGRMESSSNLTDDSDSDICSDLSGSDDDIDSSTVTSSRAITTTTKPSFSSAKTLKKLINKPVTTSSIAASSSGNSAYHATYASDTANLPTISSTSPHPPPHKRSKLTPQSVKTRRVQPIERDAQGHPKLPQQIGVLTVHHLGKIVTDRPNYHNERYIFPVGYAVSRTYPSMVDPNSNTVITSSIIDGGDYPRFQVVAADMPHEPIVANSATGAWTVVVRRSNEIRHREHSNSASGPDYYGFKHPTIAKLIQDLPGAKNLKHYVWQTFEEMEPRAAKGVMAAAEKKRGNLEQMGSANRKVPPNQPFSSSSSSKIASEHHRSAFIYEINDAEEDQVARAPAETDDEEEVDELAASDKEEDA
ncbi:F/Y-rich N-terminus-domain-containing protein [Parasitella parasitica]|nr:F/Y-rich N-terminus-domain-containing protein [Parasitella parasitica]